MRRLGKRGNLNLYEAINGWWFESELNLEDTDLSGAAVNALVSSKDARRIWNTPRTAITWVDYPDSAEKIIDHLRPLLVRLWIEGRLQKPNDA